MGILDGVCGDAIVKVAGQTIDEKVAAVTTGSFDNHNFQLLEDVGEIHIQDMSSSIRTICNLIY